MWELVKVMAIEVLEWEEEGVDDMSIMAELVAGARVVSD